MDSERWRRYFEGNRERERMRCEPLGEADFSPELRAALIHGIATFQLGEAAGGGLARRIYELRDTALDPATRRSIELYILEEGRHAGELASILRALGGRPLEKQWSNSLFTRCRRALGLRTKLMTLAAAEVVGIAFYGMIRDRVVSPAIARIIGVIAREEGSHLDFQAEIFRRIEARTSPRWRSLYRAVLALEFWLIMVAAIGTVLVDQRRLFRLLGVGPRAFARSCAREISQRRAPRALAPAAFERVVDQPRHELAGGDSALLH